MTTAGTRLVAGRYRVAKSLGQGGMGRVWLARDVVLDRDVAVKEIVLPEDLVAQERDSLRRRTLREARAAARLTHPNVAQVYDVFAVDGQPWIVMEHVSSRSLQQVLDAEGALEPQRVAEIGLEVLAALQAAHRAGVLHRDVKPSNVLLGDRGRVVLTDFGIATIEGDGSTTSSGMVLGSPQFMAPERALRGESRPASDLWSLGATLYAAVEGRPPYQRPSAVGTLMALAAEEPEPPRQAGVLRSVLDGLLRKDPDKRIDADETLRRLREAAGQTQPAAGELRWPRLQRRVPRREATAAAAPADLVSGPVEAQAAASAQAQNEAAVAPADAAAGGSAKSPVRAPIGSEPMKPATAYPRPVAEGRTRPRRWIFVVAVALLAIVGTVFVIASITDKSGAGSTASRSRDPGASPSTGASPNPSTSGSGGPSTQASASTNPSGTSAAGTDSGGTSSNGQGSRPALPGGWVDYHDRTGFSVYVPRGWTKSQDGSIVYFRRAGRVLGIDQTVHPNMNPVADWRGKADYRVANGDFPAYHEIHIKAVDYFEKAADWEFTFDGSHARQHVNNRGLVVNNHQAYGIYWQAPDAEWTSAYPDLQLIFESFRPKS